MCLRVEGVGMPQNGKQATTEDILKEVKNIISDAGLSIPEDAIDRAHRIGKGRIVAGQRQRQIIVKFTSFKHRTMLYKARKAVSPRVRIYLDLTHARKQILDDINSNIREQQLQDCFAFADVNCRLCVKMGGTFNYVSSYNDYALLLKQSPCN